MLKLEKKLVAYIDILGFTSLIEDFNSEESLLNLINDMFVYAFKVANFISKCEESISHFIFSDNIVIILDKTELCKEDVVNFVKFISCFQMACADSQIFVRGGIDYGNIYVSKRYGYIFGTALVNAYKLESAIAKFPRIILSVETQILLKELNALNRFLMCDVDNIYFINYLSSYFSAFSKEAFETLEVTQKLIHILYRHKASILLNISNISKKNTDIDKTKIIHKYKWAIYYYNFFLKSIEADYFYISEKEFIQASNNQWNSSNLQDFLDYVYSTTVKEKDAIFFKDEFQKSK